MMMQSVTRNRRAISRTRWKMAGIVLMMAALGACATNTPPPGPGDNVANSGSASRFDANTRIVRTTRRIRVTPGNAERAYNSGDRELGKYMAEVALRLGKYSARDRARYQVILGKYYGKRKDFRKSIAYFTMAAQSGTDVAPSAVGLRALTLKFMGQYQAALADTRRCVTLAAKFPGENNTMCYVAETMVHLSSGQFAKAERAARIANKSSRKPEASLWMFVGIAQLYQKKFGPAERAFSRALSINPNHRVARAGLRAALDRRPRIAHNPWVRN